LGDGGMEVLSPSEQTYLIDQCCRESKVIFDKFAPIGLFWYKNLELKESFLFGDISWSSFEEPFPLQTLDRACYFLNESTDFCFSSKEHELGTFLLIGKSSESMLQQGLDLFCASLTISMHFDHEKSTLSLNIKDLLHHLLYKTN
jgi:hypothetical protein